MHSWFKYYLLKSISICLVWQFSHAAYSQPDQLASGTKNCNSFIAINVESNINEFSFFYGSLNLSSTWQTVHYNDTGYFEIHIPIKDFEASNPLMYNDFLDLLHEKEFPELTICIANNQLENAGREPAIPFQKIKITLAGITRTYDIGCTLDECNNNLLIQGETKIRLTDFKISPPVKLNGLVKVRNEIDINFGLIITFADKTSIALH